MTGINYVTNDRGQKTAVQISLRQWDNMQKKLKNLEVWADLKRAFREMELHEKGKLKTPTTKQLLASL